MSTGVLANGELMQTYADKFMDIYCIEQRENLKEKIISQIKTICDKEKRIRNWMLYKAEQSEVR